MILCLIVAAAQNSIIGNQNKLPWQIPEDLKYFKEVTLGKPIIMGRKTFESIGRPLPKRRNIVISRSSEFKADGVEIFPSIEKALDVVQKSVGTHDEVFIVGGGEIYRESLSKVKRAYVTEIHKDFDGDAKFPLEQVKKEFKVISKKDFSGPVPFSFLVYERL